MIVKGKLCLFLHKYLLKQRPHHRFLMNIDKSFFFIIYHYLSFKYATYLSFCLIPITNIAMPANGANGMTNGEDPNQTAPL